MRIVSDEKQRGEEEEEVFVFHLPEDVVDGVAEESFSVVR